MRFYFTIEFIIYFIYEANIMRIFAGKTCTGLRL